MSAALARIPSLRAKLQEIYRRANNALAEDAPPAAAPLAEVVRYHADEALLELADLEADLLEEARRG